MEKLIFEFDWQDNVKLNAVTPKWIAKLIIWSVIIAYLPNIIWYFTGYPLDAVLMQFIVMTIGMPPIVFLSMKAYRKQYSTMPLRGSLWMDTSNVVLTKVIMSQTFRRYIEVWKSGMPLIEEITFNKDTGHLVIQSFWHVEAYTRKRNGRRGALIATDSIKKMLEVKITSERVDELDKFLKLYYHDITSITEKGEVTDEQEV